MEAFPFQSNFLGMDDQDNPQYDRAVGADFIHEKDKLFYTNGIFPNPSTNFQVMAQGGLGIIIKPGTCFIQGVTGIEIDTITLTLDQPEELTNRTDFVVLRCDFVNRLIEVAIKKGPTTLTRNSNVWELKLAEIAVPRMVSAISQANITDTRVSSECGIVTGAVKTVDTSTLYNQYYVKWQEVKALMATNESAYNAWYNAFTTTAETLFGQRIDDFDAWFNENKTAIFDAEYFDFDNIVYRAGYTCITTKRGAGNYLETIINTLSREIYATRETIKQANGSWVSRVICTKHNIDVTEATQKINGTWESVVEYSGSALVVGNFMTGEALVGGGTTSKRAIERVIPEATRWINHQTPVDEDNLNKIEGSLQTLDVDKVSRGNIKVDAGTF